MTILLSIDPGVHESGLALFEKQHLVEARLLPSDEFPPVARDVCLEVPRYYPGRNRVDPNTLIDLARAGERLAMRAGPCAVTYYYPAQWKGQLPKNVVWRKALDVLNPEELAIVQALKYPHTKRKGHGCLDDVHDAIALGLVHLGRLRLR